MQIEYSPDVRSLYVRLFVGEVAETVELDEEVYADLDAAGKPVEVEFVDAHDFFPFLARHAPAPDGIAAFDLPDALTAVVRRRQEVLTS